MAGLEFVVLVFIIAIPALMVWALIDLLNRPAEQFSVSGQDRLVWAVVVVFLALIGPILYLTIGRSRLDSHGRIDSRLSTS